MLDTFYILYIFITCITLDVSLLLSTVRKYICRNYQINTKLYPAHYSIFIQISFLAGNTAPVFALLAKNMK